MKKFIVLFVVAIICLMNVSQVRGDADDGTNVFYYDDSSWQTINDWTEVGAYGYEDYWTLTSEVDTPNDTASGAGYETRLYIETPDTVAIYQGMWAGYEWEVPGAADEAIIQFHIEGYFSYGAGLELRITDGNGRLLYTYGGGVGAIDVNTSTFTGVDKIRVIMYGTAPTGAWGWGGNYVYVGLHEIITEDGAVDAPADKNVPAYGFHTTDQYGADVNGIANIAHMNWDDDEADVSIANGMKLMPDTTWQFWSGVYDSGLRADFVRQWGLYKQLLYGYEDDIAAIYIFDEPYLAAHGLDAAELEIAVACVKADFPDIPVAVCFAHPSVTAMDHENDIPDNLDWIAYDQYGTIETIAGLAATLETYKETNQKIFLNPQGYEGYAGGDSDATVAGWSYDYHDIYLSNPEILGQLVFLCRGTREDLYPGHSANIPLTYAAQDAIGAEVLKMGDTFERAFSDHFELSADWTANWASKGSWRRLTTRKRTGSYGAEIDGNVNNSALESVAIDVSGADNASVRFWWYIESGLDSGEYIRFDVKHDSGSWTQAKSIDGNVDSENTWANEFESDIDVSSTTNLYIRFRGKMNRSTEDAYIDNVNVYTW